MNRDEILVRVRERTEPWDIIVIGGGATGVGCAVDAASRGFDVLLLEQHDFGKGTSSRSTKLVHGGFRYLKQGDLSLVRESLRERGILLRNAPHVVHKQAFIVPCFSRWQKIYYGSGLKVYDLLSGKYSFGRSRILSKKETVECLENVKTEGLSGGILYFDGQFDDSRLLIDLVRTAHDHGAAALNYTKAHGFQKNASGKVIGVEAEDKGTGETFLVSAKVIINATGAFCDTVRAMSNDSSKPIVTLSQGVHLVFARKFLPCDTAIMVPKTRDGRVLFCIPWLGATLVGTTDTPTTDADLEPHALGSEIDFILETVAEYFSTPPSREDILSIFVGIRPLVRSGAEKNTASLSRGHTVEINEAGLLTITGGKWTTYRHMAEDAVDQACRFAGLPMRPSVTETLRIAGTEAADGGSALLHPDLPYTAEDITRSVRTEMAQTVEDVLARRTRSLFLNAKAAIEMAPAVAQIMAIELQLDDRWVLEQIGNFNRVAGAYLTPQISDPR